MTLLYKKDMLQNNEYVFQIVLNYARNSCWNLSVISDSRRILVGNKIVDHSEVVGASPVGAARTTSSFST